MPIKVSCLSVFIGGAGVLASKGDLEKQICEGSGVFDPLAILSLNFYMNEENWREKLWRVIFEADTPWGRRFDVLLFWAIILSVFSIILESDRSIRALYGIELRYVEWFFTILFSVEYSLRIISSPDPRKYIFSFFGIVDFISIAPTYLSFFVPGSQFLIVIRAIRLLRVFRVLKLVRYLRESQVLLDALMASRVKITVFLGAVLTVVLIVGTLMHLVEAGNPGFSNIFKGMYWAVVTLTTVGYGDSIPVTTLGKFLASILMIMGYGIIAVPTGIVSVELSNASKKTVEGMHCSKCNLRSNIADARFCHKCGCSLQIL